MTTLPQTSPVRMPRPVMPGQLAIPGAGPVAVPGPVGGGGIQLTPADIWRVLRSNWWLIALLLAVALVAGFFVNRHLNAYHKRYTATGFVRVETSSELTRSRDIGEVNPNALAI